MWRERIFAEILLEFNPYHDLYGRFAHAYGGEAELERAYVGQARMESRAGKVGLVAIKAAVADARRAAQEGGKPPQLDLKIHAKVEGGRPGAVHLHLEQREA